MEDNYFNKASVNLRTAKIVRTYGTGDELEINQIAYMLSQAVELSIKYLLEINGIEYYRTHDIDQLIKCGKDNNIDLYLTEYINDHSEMFTQWESKTRYVLNYQIELGKVDKALMEVEIYLNNIINNFNK